MRSILQRLGVLAGLLLVLSAAPATAQTAVGDWLGTVAPGPQSFREAVHIRAAAGGGYTGVLDRIDRAEYGLPLADIALAGDTLSFSLPGPTATPSTYAAKWDAASGRWKGHWTVNGRPIALDLAPGVAPPSPTIDGLDGRWEGAVRVGTASLRLVLHVRTGPGGTVAWLDSPDQLAMGLTVNTLSRDGPHVRFALTALAVDFSGDLATDGQTLAGQWSQAGTSLPAAFSHRSTDAASLKPARPQTPVKPYPYREEDVTFDDAGAQVRLAGTLTLPPGAGPFPAVVLVAGSGPNTRNEPIFDHQIFQVLADHLTRHGIAVLRYDKRGVGASTGDYAKATTMDFADDAQAAVAYLAGRPEIDPRHIGLIGHSEGGLIVPIVAARDPGVAFIVMMAGPGVNGMDILTEQGRLISRAMGMTEAQVDEMSNLRSQIFAIVRTEKDPVVAAAKLRAAYAAYALAHHLPEHAFDSQIAAIDNDWFRFFFAYDPATTLSRVRQPVLALDGGLDLQVPPAQNLPPISAALAHNPDAEVDELPGLNHLFQTARTGAMGEYGQIEETLAPLALDLMTAWILKHAGRP
jgi:dienelactone hydrolase